LCPATQAAIIIIPRENYESYYTQGAKS